MLEKFNTEEQAKASFEKVEGLENGKYSKILVDGSTGKLLNQSGPQNWIGQNIMYMYKHVQGKVFDGKFSAQ